MTTYIKNTLLLCLMFCATIFVGCSDDDNDGVTPLPEGQGEVTFKFVRNKVYTISTLEDMARLKVTLEKDGSSMEKVLSSILSLPELVDCYDNDILFTFRGLLNEQAGANIRNEIAHGIISEYACSTGVCLYFGVAVIKLLSLTSASCYQILKNSEKLKHFEMPRKDALKVIH